VINSAPGMGQILAANILIYKSVTQTLTL